MPTILDVVMKDDWEIDDCQLLTKWETIEHVRVQKSILPLFIIFVLFGIKHRKCVVAWFGDLSYSKLQKEMFSNISERKRN